MELWEINLFILILLKPMYGLVDAPFLWGIVLAVMLKNDCGGTPSLLDNDFYYWTEKGHIVAIFAVHIDDILAVGTQYFLDWCRGLLEGRFGDVKRQLLPFTHIGIRYTRLPTHSIVLEQREIMDRMDPVQLTIEDKRHPGSRPCMHSGTTA